MRYRLRTLVILTALGPPAVAALLMLSGGAPVNSAVIAVAAYVGLLATLLVGSWFAERFLVQSPTDASSNPHFESQVAAFDQQTKEQDRLLAEHEQSMRLGDELRLKQEANAQRMSALLDKMEEQARRRDAILDAEEKQLGIKV